ncbi:NAD(P)H-hydrate dehydratase [Acidipila rosea]|uniref:Bifunctional NAD(P)H-hydrate repair enzyme n=1 Tax=Acidipila rosea TaxID=768535 RepID=A0A4R1L543_9BACT|nr:NAD(P)H-hydrate dehydratase [Acidipila rosea]TCK72113.1 NAD(P)H-hydrate epimerase [Acidipila rosea]
MKILSAEEMRVTDRVTMEAHGVPSLSLMNHAGEAVARFILREFPAARCITVLCGKGNNGGDGLVAARALATAGCDVGVLLLGNPSDLKGDAAEMFRRMPLPVTIVEEEAALATPEVGRLLDSTELLVDAVVGTGFKPPLRGPAAALRDRIRTLTSPIVAVDLPSGWDADSRNYDAEGAFRADAVVTFTAPKLAHACGNLTGSAYRPIVVAAIGSPEAAVRSDLNLTWAGSSKKIAAAPRAADDNKGRHGHVLVIGGSHGKAGAPSMASLAALRTGAGLVTAAVAGSMLSLVASTTPELMTVGLSEGQRGEIDARNLESTALDALLARKTVIALGPGLGQEPATEEFVLGLLARTRLPMVIDADALNILAKHRELIDGRDRTLILTPHPGEMSRLAGLSVKEVQSEREPLAREFATRHQLTLVLKGWRTLIAHPDGSIAFNTTGNPGMAKGGSGDILTGIVAAMVAQYPDQLADAVNAAVYLHGLAADFAVREQDEHTLLATDTIAHLFRAFRFNPHDPAGYVWFEGLPR